MKTTTLNSPDSQPVDASPDALDETAIDADAEIALDSANRRRQLRKLKTESRFLRRQEGIGAKQRAKHAARAYEQFVMREHQDEPVFFEWNPNRALNRQDFDYLFFHRQQFNKKVKTWLEFIASKISHGNEDGKPGYFNKLEKNVGWTGYITPLLFTGIEITDKLVRCGIWANSRNSRRCHKPDFCSLCLWNDILKVLVAAFGSRSGAFFKAPAWWLITIGWTTNARNAKCAAGHYDPEDNRPPRRDRGYDPYPVVLGSDDGDGDMGWLGYQDARVLGLAMQQAVSDLYQDEYIDGCKSKLEAAYRLHPGGATRLNLHCHTVANGREEDGESIAQELRLSVERFMSRWKGQLNRDYFVDIKVGKISSPEQLENATRYSEKLVPVDHMVSDALSRPEAKLPDGGWSPGYVDRLTTSLRQLIEDDLPSIFSGARLEPDLPQLFRRKTLGNMQFKDNGTCVGNEPGWHAQARRKHAAKQRLKRREKKQKKEAVSSRLGKPIPAPRKYLRRRKNPRRLARSLRSKN